MNLTSEDVQQFAKAAQAFESAAKVIESIGEMRPNNTAIAHSPPPDKGANLVVIACAVLIGMNIFLSGALVVMGIRMFDLDDKLSAIYMMAPHLKPAEEAK